jgi:hypothetical protein
MATLLPPFLGEDLEELAKSITEQHYQTLPSIYSV